MSVTHGVDIQIRAEDIDNLVRSISKHADKKSLRRELHRGLNKETKDIRGKMVEAIPAALPERGGLAAEVQGGIRSRIAAKSGKYAGVSMKFSHSSRDVRTLIGKRLRHPVFGNRSVWVDQTAGVDPAVFTGEFENQTSEIRDAIFKTLDEVARKVANI